MAIGAAILISRCLVSINCTNGRPIVISSPTWANRWLILPAKGALIMVFSKASKVCSTEIFKAATSLMAMVRSLLTRSYSLKAELFFSRNFKKRAFCPVR